MDRFRKRFSDCFSLIVIGIVIICLLMLKDAGTTAAIRFLAAVFLVSFLMRPYFPKRSIDYPDGGFALCFGLGLALCFYLCWTFCAATSFEFSDAAVYGSFAVLAAAGYAVNAFVLKKPYAAAGEFREFTRGFAVFAVIFLAFFYIIGFNPLVDPGTENYMDFGFMQTIYRQENAVPNDLWFSGTGLNYYYLGQAAAVYMCRLAKTTPEYGYNLMLALFAGMVFMMVYELVAGIAGLLMPDARHRRLPAAVGGVAGGAIAAFAANPHWILYGPVLTLAKKILGTDDGKRYWFPDGTVYIAAQYGDPDNGKNEFPAYSVILGDLHAHVVNLIFVLPLLAVLFEYASDGKEDDSRGYRAYMLLLLAVLLGIYKGSNYWDFAIYYVICGAVIVFTDIKKKKSIKVLAGIAVKAASITVVSVMAILPFTLRFAKMESGFAIAEAHSPVGKLAVLWAPAVITAAALIGVLYRGCNKDTYSKSSAREGLLALTLCTVGLVLVPEVVYVRDIYGGDNKRFNTMFKLTYQAFVLFAILFGITVALIVYAAIRRQRAACAGLCLAIASVYCILAVSYTPYAIRQRYGNIFDPGSRSGISSLEGLRSDETYGFEMEAYDYLMGDERRVVNIVEAAGDSYTHESALSVYTGTCTTLGWFVHEWMWHNDPAPVTERADLVGYFYKSGDEDFCRDFLKKYEVDYIFVGPAEVCKYPVNQNGFRNLGDICCETVWQGCDLALIKVDQSRL